MLKDHLRRFQADTLRLAKLIVIKFADTATLINDAIRLRYGPDSVNDHDPASWKYYLHLAGEYHPTDEPMYIHSLDTAEQILFSKEMLAIHDATRQAYQRLEADYYRLVKRYPTQESLMRGILFPVDIDQAISADDGSILTYPTELVEHREYTLIQDLETWIKSYLIRWNVQSFMTSDTLYVPAYQAVLYLNLVQRIYNLRNRRIHTNEVHSFHLRCYLASHGRLDQYYDYLTEEQLLFLYRNIRFIERHAGNKSVFDSLIHKLLTKRQIPIAEYTLRQKNELADDWYPRYHLRKSPLNTEYNVPEKNYYSLEELADKETSLTPGNQDYWDTRYRSIEKKIQNSGHAVMVTKDLESFMYDYTDAVPHPLSEILLNEWAYYAHSGLYRSIITVKNPIKTELIGFTTDKALVYYMYLAARHLGLDVDTLPTVMAYSISRRHDATWDGVSDIASLSTLRNRYQIAQMLYQAVPQPTQHYSTQQFFTYAHRLYEARVAEWIYQSNIGDLYEQGEVAAMIQRMYYHTKLDFHMHPVLNPDQLSMNEWLFANNLPHDTFNRDDRETLMAEIFNKATGYNINHTKVLAYVQKAMISIMKQLSSYSVQFITQINTSSIRLISKPDIQPGAVGADVGSQHRYRDTAIALGSYAIAHQTIAHPISIRQEMDSIEAAIGHSAIYDIGRDDDVRVVIYDHGVYRTKAPVVRLSSGSLRQDLTPDQLNSLRI